MYVLSAKSTARFDRIAPAGFRILGALDLATRELMTNLVISCGTEGHSPDDPHTSGEAYDISVRDLVPALIVQLVEYLQIRLGSFFYTQYEAPTVPSHPALALIAAVNAGASAPHIHVQRRRGTVYPPIPNPGNFDLAMKKTLDT